VSLHEIDVINSRTQGFLALFSGEAWPLQSLGPSPDTSVPPDTAHLALGLSIGCILFSICEVFCLVLFLSFPNIAIHLPLSGDLLGQVTARCPS
jgi:hypothetical protein